MEEGLRISPVSGEILRIGGFAPVLLDALLSIVVRVTRGICLVLACLCPERWGQGDRVPLQGFGDRIPKTPHKKTPPSEEDGEEIQIRSGGMYAARRKFQEASLPAG